MGPRSVGPDRRSDAGAISVFDGTVATVSTITFVATITFASTFTPVAAVGPVGADSSAGISRFRGRFCRAALRAFGADMKKVPARANRFRALTRLIDTLEATK
jgi:hypothetical protein